MAEPYTFETYQIPISQTRELPGQYQGVHFTVIDPNNVEWILDVVEQWYGDYDEVTLVADGTTAQGLGFVILEWEECEIEPAFLVH
jgi:hypothetical protein